MKKKTAIYILIGVLFTGLALHQPAFASEVSGTLNTDGDTSGENQTPSPTPTPTPTPNPSGGDDTGGHSSEVEGNLGSGGSDNTISGVVTGGQDPRVLGFVDVGNIYYGTTTIPTITATVVDGAAPGISDEEAAHLAMLTFGPRYGGASNDFTPGAPEAGGPNLSVGSGRSAAEAALGSIGKDEALFNFPRTTVFVPRSGEGPVTPAEELAVASIGANASGLTMAQLVMIAIVGLGILGSMAYAISRGTRTGKAV
jgi:hypothetical protein